MSSSSKTDYGILSQCPRLGDIEKKKKGEMFLSTLVLEESSGKVSHHLQFKTVSFEFFIAILIREHMLLSQELDQGKNLFYHTD